jgi:hypothetical protein
LLRAAIAFQVLFCEIIHNEPVVFLLCVTWIGEMLMLVKTKVQIKSAAEKVDSVLGIADQA